MKPQGKVTIFMVVMIVMLSIYYFALPNNNNIGNGPTTTDPGESAMKSEEFEQLRAQVDESRQTMIADLQGILVQTDVSVEDKNTAIETIQRIETMAQNENLLETTIMNLGYDDVFVKATDNDVNISVYVDNLTLEEVNQMILVGKGQFGPSKNVVVNFTIVDVN